MITTYSDYCHDLFAWVVNNRKNDGYLVDIGARGPTNSNSLFLLQQGWSGTLIDQHDHTDQWTMHKVKFYAINATIKEKLDEAFKTVPDVVDYLSLDIDENGLKCLNAIDLNKFKFKCITIEHNKAYSQQQEEPQREILNKYGYFLLVKNFGMGEDWWVHPDFIDIEEFEYLNKLSETTRALSKIHTDSITEIGISIDNATPLMNYILKNNESIELLRDGL